MLFDLCELLVSERHTPPITPPRRSLKAGLSIALTFHATLGRITCSSSNDKPLRTVDFLLVWKTTEFAFRLDGV